MSFRRWRHVLLVARRLLQGIFSLCNISRDKVVRGDNVYSSLYNLMGIAATSFLVTQDMETMH